MSTNAIGIKLPYGASINLISITPYVKIEDVKKKPMSCDWFQSSNKCCKNGEYIWITASLKVYADAQFIKIGAGISIPNVPVGSVPLPGGPAVSSSQGSFLGSSPICDSGYCCCKDKSQ